MARKPRQLNLNHAIWRIRIANECVFGASGKQLSGPAKSVLMNLAINVHYDPSSPKPGTSNATTFVGVEKLAATSAYSTDTVSRSLKLLETEKLISRYVRNGNVRTSRVTKLHWDAIIAGKLPDVYSDVDAEEGTPTFSESAEDDTDGLDASEPNVATKPMGVSTQKSAPKPGPKASLSASGNTMGPNSAADIGIDMLVQLLHRAFPDHDNFVNERNVGYLRQNLRAGVEQGGSVELLYDVCSRLLADDGARAKATRKKLGESRNIANYLRAALRGDLLERYAADDPRVDVEEDEELDKFV
jgi:hypothetical protein